MHWNVVCMIPCILMSTWVPTFRQHMNTCVILWTQSGMFHTWQWKHLTKGPSACKCQCVWTICAQYTQWLRKMSVNFNLPYLVKQRKSEDIYFGTYQIEWAFSILISILVRTKIALSNEILGLRKLFHKDNTCMCAR